MTIYVYVCVCTRLYMCNVCIYGYTCLYVCLYMHKDIYTHICVYVYALCVYIYFLCTLVSPFPTFFYRYQGSDPQFQ